MSRIPAENRVHDSIKSVWTKSAMASVYTWSRVLGVGEAAKHEPDELPGAMRAKEGRPVDDLSPCQARGIVHR